MKILAKEEAFLVDHEKQVRDLKTLQTTHKRARVANKVKRGVAKVAKAAGKIASAVVGHDPEAADVDVVA